MAPTLMPGERFVFVPVVFGSIVRGDILLFRPSEKDREIVHRAVSFEASGIRTCGDNPNNQIDSFVLTSEEIIGRVTGVYRENRFHEFARGKKGLLWHYWVRFLSRGLAPVRKILGPVYRQTSKVLYLGHLLPSKYRPIILRIQRGSRSSWMIASASKVVGRRFEPNQPWSISFPYSLFIRKSALEDLDRKRS